MFRKFLGHSLYVVPVGNVLQQNPVFFLRDGDSYFQTLNLKKMMF